MVARRTDLALEAGELWREEGAGAPPGVEEAERTEDGFQLREVRVLDARGAEALGKPVGRYITLELDPLSRREEDALGRGAALLAKELRRLLPLGEGETVLVCGLGNAAITPDRIGPEAIRHTLATRHLLRTMPKTFSGLRPVCALETGVMGVTGLESAELIRAVTDCVRPAAVIAVDALAARRLRRICRTVQLSDTGIVPGSGVGNARAELSAATLGVPVIAVGVPTVVDAGTLAADLLREAGAEEPPEELLSGVGEELFVTPRLIDSQVRDAGKLIGLGIDLALHEGLTVEDVEMLL